MCRRQLYSCYSIAINNTYWWRCSRIIFPVCNWLKGKDLQFTCVLINFYLQLHTMLHLQHRSNNYSLHLSMAESKCVFQKITGMLLFHSYTCWIFIPSGHSSLACTLGPIPAYAASVWRNKSNTVADIEWMDSLVCWVRNYIYSPL